VPVRGLHHRIHPESRGVKASGEVGAGDPVTAVGNWAMCPRCKTTREDAAAEAHRNAIAAYGIVSVTKFDALRDEADRLSELIDNPPGAGQGRTFREDWEITGAEDGEVFVGYCGACTDCGLTLKFEHTHPLDIGVTS
jgi:hypothetical protein